MFEDLQAKAVSEFHDLCHRHPDWPGQPPRPLEDNSLWFWVAANHRHNCLLWAEEDQARRRDVPDADIVKNKRLIDANNQARNDAIERMDEHILTRLAGVTLRPDAWLNSETAGSIIDRLSIISLKILHMQKHTENPANTEALREETRQKLSRLHEQRGDLQFCLDQLLNGYAEGRCYYRIYRQFKMYNDPRLNPYLAANARRG
ncbi:MAG: hypothetical protein H6R10_1642 [Rhodocyclaceae bacterium]|nr:hypothetical protein [Rhodocyclaceae bacterium]